MKPKNTSLIVSSFIFIFAMALSFSTFATALNVKVTEEGFEPKIIEAKAGTELTLNVTRVTDSTCATDIQVPEKKIKRDLPLNKAVKITLGKFKSGDYPFGCSMGMMIGGTIKVR